MEAGPPLQKCNMWHTLCPDMEQKGYQDNLKLLFKIEN